MADWTLKSSSKCPANIIGSSETFALNTAKWLCQDGTVALIKPVRLLFSIMHEIGIF